MGEGCTKGISGTRCEPTMCAKVQPGDTQIRIGVERATKKKKKGKSRRCSFKGRSLSGGQGKSKEVIDRTEIFLGKCFPLEREPISGWSGKKKVQGRREGSGERECVGGDWI